MNTYRGVALVLSASMLLSAAASAEDNLWVGVKAGTLGIGLEGTWRPTDWLDIRVGANRYDYDANGTEAGIGYDGNFRLDTYYATANFRFPLSPFRLSVGGYSNGNQIDLVSQDNPTLEIGGITYTAQEAGTLRSETTFDSMSPYVGAGFDFELFGKVGMNFDFGVLLQGDPHVTLTADGLLADTQSFIDSLEAERAELLNEVDTLKAYPVVSLGFNFNF